MTVKERVLALRLLEKQKKNPELAKRLGINVYMKKNGKEKKWIWEVHKIIQGLL